MTKLRDLPRFTRRATRGLFDALAEVGGARLYPPRDAHAATHRLAAAAGALARAHDLAVTVRGEVPRSPVLLVAQGVGYLDALALLPICPALPIAPAALLQWPVIGALSSAFGVACVTRADPMARARTLRRVHDLLRAGISVVDWALPPASGTTSGAFRRGSFGIATRLGIPVVPVAFRYADPALAWRAGSAATRHYLRLAAHRRIEIELSFGAPMWARTGEPPEVMADRARRRIARALARDAEVISLAARRSASVETR